MVPSTLILLPIDYVLQNMKDEPEVIRVYQEQIIKWGMKMCIRDSSYTNQESMGMNSSNNLTRTFATYTDGGNSRYRTLVEYFKYKN